MSQYHDLQMTGPQLDERLAQVLTNETAIGNEADARESADQTLQGNIDQKANADNVYTKVQTNNEIDVAVNVEKLRAQGAESDLQRNIDQKANTADVYDKSQVYTKQQTDAAIDVEKTRAESEEARIDIQIELNESEQSLKATPDLVEVNVGANIVFTAESSISTHIAIMQGTHIVAEGDGTMLQTTHALIPETLGVTTFLAVFTKNGAVRTVEKNVHSVLPIKFGAGATYASAQTEKLSLTPDGKYNITASDGDYIWLCVPASMTIEQALMSSIEMQFNAPDTTTISGYKIYRSKEAYQAGTYEIEII